MLDEFGKIMAKFVEQNPGLVLVTLALMIPFTVEQTFKRLVKFKHRMVYLWRKFKEDPPPHMDID